ncbi:MAG: hypothetical protein QOE65_1092 [Solirubrobacteraceae bacterium]|jgi:hypothetical protein|nr:hypothetical protein [Solirubrobacteraceae bacterium]
MEAIEQGVRIEVRDIHGQWLERIALGGVVDGRDFPVVWACREKEWDAAADEEREADGTPWPAEDVRVAVKSGSATPA